MGIGPEGKFWVLCITTSILLSTVQTGLAHYFWVWPCSLAANTALMLPFDGLGLTGLIAAAHLCQKLKLPVPYFLPIIFIY